GDEHAVDVARREPEARQPPLGVGEVEAAVEQHPGERGAVPCLHDQAVSPAAARERSEAKQRYFSCSWSSTRMRCAVGLVSAPPSLFRTFTVLASLTGLTCTRNCSALTFGSLEPNRRENRPFSLSFFAISLSGSA